MDTEGLRPFDDEDHSVPPFEGLNVDLPCDDPSWIEDLARTRQYPSACDGPAVEVVWVDGPQTGTMRLFVCQAHAAWVHLAGRGARTSELARSRRGADGVWRALRPVRDPATGAFLRDEVVEARGPVIGA